MTMRERIARRLCEADGEDADDVVHSIVDDTPYQAWHPYLNHADAVIAELETPTGDMVDTILGGLFVPPNNITRDAARAAWSAAIRAAREGE